MAILKNAKRAGRFVFVDLPLGVVGYSQLRLGNRVIGDLWRSLRSDTCPQCNHGVLLRRDDDQATSASDVKYPWACSSCDFVLLENADARAVRDTVRSIRQQQTLELLGQAEASSRRKRVRQYAVQSRVFFVLALAALGWFLYQVATGAGLLYSAHLASLAMAAGAVALKASYRAWQVETGTLFQEGAFLRFLRHERWLR